jgi:hypothetical protein
MCNYYPVLNHYQGVHKVTQEAKDFIRDYQGHSNFFLSLKKQSEEKGYLTEKQIGCINRHLESTKKSELSGQEITIKTWIARQLADEFNMPFFFRNLKIKEVHRETQRALNVTVGFVSKIATKCHCCGRDLDNEISKATGVGPVCAKKYLGIKRPSLANAKEILAKIDEEAKNAGEIGPFWLPKSQIL